MARQLRIEIAGALYHVLARGNEKKRIFRTSTDRDCFLALLPRAHTKYGCSFYAYSLLPNHYHLLIEIKKQNLSKVMHFINVSYSIYFNKRHKRIGHLFQGRFKSILVQKEPYLLELSRYIHTNPDHAGFNGKISEKRWTSFYYYVGPYKNIPWLHTGWIIERFGDNWSTAQRKYAHFIEDGLSNPPKNPFENAYKGVILGAENFIDKTKRASKKKLNRDFSSYKSLSKLHTFNSIIKMTSSYFSISSKKLFERKKLFLPRQIAMYLLKEYTDLTQEAIGRNFGITGFAVSKTAKKVSENANSMKIIRELRQFLEKQ